MGPDVIQEPFCQQPLRKAKLSRDLIHGRNLGRFLAVNNFKPDIIFVKADATRRNHIRELAQLPGRKVLLMGDTHHLASPLQTMLAYAMQEPWDLISSEHDRHHLLLFAEAGLRRLIWLPCFTMNPYKHHPRSPIDHRVVFVGSLSPHHQQRQRVIRQLQEKSIPLHLTTASQAEAAALYNKHSISLNVSLNGDLNFRIMEVLAAGGCLLTDRLGPDSGLNKLFTEGIHYLAYSSSDEAADHIRNLVANPDRRQVIAEAGFQRFWSCCSPEVQSQALLAALSGQPVPELFQAPQ